MGTLHILYPLRYFSMSFNTKKTHAMNNHDLALFQQAVNLANQGQKEIAYRQLVELIKIPDNQQEVEPLLWLAFTAPDFSLANQAIKQAVSLAPKHPKVIAACKWLADKAADTPQLSKQGALAQFRSDFITYSKNGTISDEQWTLLTNSIVQSGLKLEEALVFIQPDVVKFISRAIEAAAEDGFISDDEERNIYLLMALFALPDQATNKLRQRLELLKIPGKLREGKLPIVKSHLPLPTGEIAHIEMSASKNSENKVSNNGFLIATNRRLFFSGLAGSLSLEWTAIEDTLAYGNKLEVKPVSADQAHIFKLEDAALFKMVVERLIQLAVRSALSTEFRVKKQTQELKPSPATESLTSSRPQTLKNRNSPIPTATQPEASPAEKSFLAAWTEYAATQSLKIELTPEYEILSGRYRLDFAHPGSKSAVEIDGFAAHSSTEQIANDRRREREITQLGWRFVRFGGKEITKDVYGCVAETYRFITRRILEKQKELAQTTPQPNVTQLVDAYQTIHKPERIRTLFICESDWDVASFYRMEDVLFEQTKNSFAKVMEKQWPNPLHFLSVFKKKGYYLIGFCPGDLRQMDKEQRQREYEKQFLFLVKQLSTHQPEQIIVIWPSLKHFVEAAIPLAKLDVDKIKLHALPFPGKGYEENFKTNLVQLVRDRK
jgi:very-short-patch-repair endonuclease